MVKYLVDVNLPHYFSIWHNSEFVFQKDLNDEAKDSEIWTYAKENNLTILTKDADFVNKILFSIPPPKVIHFKTENLLTKDFL